MSLDSTRQVQTMYTYKHIYAYMYVYTDVRINVYKNTYIYIYIYIYRQIRTAQVNTESPILYRAIKAIFAPKSSRQFRFAPNFHVNHSLRLHTNIHSEMRRVSQTFTVSAGAAFTHNVHICMYECLHACACVVYMYECLHACACVVCMCVCICMNVYMHVRVLCTCARVG